MMLLNENSVLVHVSRMSFLSERSYSYFMFVHNQDYVNSVEQLFKDQRKSKILDKDLTITRMKTLENYLKWRN